MKFIFGFFAGLLTGMLMLVSTISAFIAGYWLAEQSTTPAYQRTAKPNTPTTTEEEVPVT